MNEIEKTTEIPSRRFHCQWDEFEPTSGQVFTEPSETIPDQSMTIPEIIARFTRTGQLPGTVKMVDQGGNVAADPESDPLDEWNDVQDAVSAAKAAKAANGTSAPASVPVPGVSGESAQGQKGEGGD